MNFLRKILKDLDLIRLKKNLEKYFKIDIEYIEYFNKFKNVLLRYIIISLLLMILFNNIFVFLLVSLFKHYYMSIFSVLRDYIKDEFFVRAITFCFMFIGLMLFFDLYNNIYDYYYHRPNLYLTQKDNPFEYNFFSSSIFKNDYIVFENS